jgi:hypothetical protein
MHVELKSFIKCNYLLQLKERWRIYENSHHFFKRSSSAIFATSRCNTREQKGATREMT